MPDTTTFTHLHVHSHYSLLDGAIHPKALVKQAADYGMDSLALTDHGNLYGAIEFYSAARDAGINPILGCEAYIVPGDATVKPPPGEKRPRYHVTLLARDREGFQNLSRLSTLSWTRARRTPTRRARPRAARCAAARGSPRPTGSRSAR